MEKKSIVIFVFFLLILVSTDILAAHVPIVSDGNYSIEDATHIHDPTKSWAIYSELSENHVHYYKMELEEGDRLRVILYVPQRLDFVPSFMIMGPGIENDLEPPDHIDIPETIGFIVKKGKMNEPEYEPFTPASYYYLADYDGQVNESGTYYIAVFEEDHEGGSYGLAVGAEERYGVIEWIKVPVDILSIRIWEGQSLLEIFAPMIVVFIGGILGFIYIRKVGSKIPKGITGWLPALGGILYIGSGGIILYQMVKASTMANPGVMIILTLLFAMMPVILGVFLIKNARYLKKPINNKERLKLAIYVLLGLFVWAGFIIGPLIVLITIFLPKNL